MALASIAEYEPDDVAKSVRDTGARMKSALRAIDSPIIGDVRGRGLMLGIELVRGASDPQPNAPAAVNVVKTALRGGLLLLAGGPDGNVLSITPPFTIDDTEIVYAASLLGELLRGFEQDAPRLRIR
jgi:4-aminobutyrate aminotransferase-like enzyme